MAIAHLGAVWALRGARTAPLPAVPVKKEKTIVAAHLRDYAYAPPTTTTTTSTAPPGKGARGSKALLGPDGGAVDGYLSLPSPGTVPMDFFLQVCPLLCLDIRHRLASSPSSST